jgi:lysylphosphatidylglycerol synthetase-like protein (DUF2156 family)
MAKIRPRVPIGIPIAAVVLFILGLVAGPIIESTVPEEKLATNVLISAIPFIFIFVAIVLVFITIVWLVATALGNNIPERIHRPIETICIAGIALGVVAMFQPWSLALYRIGFFVLLISTLSFILWSHVIPKGVRRQEEIGSVSISEFEKGDIEGSQ